MYRALCAYQDEGLSVEEAAAKYGVSPHVLRRRMQAQGWRTRTWKQTGKRRHGNTRRIPDTAVADAQAGTPTWVLAQRYGVGVVTMQQWLARRGSTGKTRTHAPHLTEQSDRARERVEAMLALRAKGLTYGQIAIRLGIPRGGVSAALSRHQRGVYRWQRTTTTREGTQA